MAIYTLHNISQQEVGKFDNVLLEYHTFRSLNLGQIFIHPKYKKSDLGSVGISKTILRQLAMRKCKTIRFTILGYHRVFDAVIDFNGFMEKSIDFQAKGKKLGDSQKIIYLAEMHIIDLEQARLEA